MPHLVVQIPCLNEAEQLPRTLADVPRHISGIDRMTIVVIDDGSTDASAQIARDFGASVLVLQRHHGLGHAFAQGLEHSLALGADIIVNFDADGQYDGSEIAGLIAPILDGTADMTIGVRDVAGITEFSWLKRRLHALGRRVVRLASGLSIEDPVSGFRAISRQTASTLRIHSRYTYTVESLIQAGAQGQRVTCIPITRRSATRPSRLIRSLPLYIVRQGATILRSWAYWAPLSFSAMLALGTGVVTGILLLLWLTLRALV